MTDGRVLDTSALLDAATGRTIYVRALIRAAVRHNITLAVPAGVLLAAWADVPPEGRPFLDLALELPVAVVDVLDEEAARDGGLLLAGGDRVAARADVAHAVLSAHRRKWAVVTSAPGALRDVDPEIEVEVLP